MPTPASQSSRSPLQPSRILVVAPHPDDDVIGMGGTMARLIAEGACLSVVYVAPGARSTRSFAISDADMAKLRRAEATLAALDVLNVRSIRFLDMEYPNQTEEREAWTQQVRQEIAAALDDFSPRVLYVPHPLDGHRTHQGVTQTVLDLLWDAPASRPSVLGYETWTPIQSPGAVIDITAFEAIKRQAIRCHQSQVKDKAYEDGIMGLNRYRAVFHGPERSDAVRYAEAFVRLLD